MAADYNSDFFPAFLGGLYAGVVGFAYVGIGFKIVPSTYAPEGVSMTYSDMSATMLGAVSVMVTILGVFVAILAIWGYVHFRRTTKEAALSYIKSQIEEGQIKNKLEELVIYYFKEDAGKPDSRLRTLLAERIDAIILNDARDRDQTEADGEFRE